MLSYIQTVEKVNNSFDSPSKIDPTFWKNDTQIPQSKASEWIEKAKEIDDFSGSFIKLVAKTKKRSNKFSESLNKSEGFNKVPKQVRSNILKRYVVVKFKKKCSKNSTESSEGTTKSSKWSKNSWTL